jgi:hypothetical protein
MKLRKIAAHQHLAIWLDDNRIDDAVRIWVEPIIGRHRGQGTGNRPQGGQIKETRKSEAWQAGFRGR